MINVLKKYISPFRKLVYSLTGRKPWSYGYNDTRWELIDKNLNNASLISSFQNKKIPAGFAIGFDERAVEYLWIFSKLSDNPCCLLDAGSTFNFPQIAFQPKLKGKILSIFTFYPEPNNFASSRISYVYGDLREMPFKDSWFDEVVCQSTIEHVDMDNSIYGYELAKNEDERKKSYEYMKVVEELIRVLKSKGRLLLTFPYGKFEHHGFFQQFDAEMVQHIFDRLQQAGQYSADYILYHASGWSFAAADDCKNSESYNPHTGKGKGNDGAAHCRAVCCIEFVKY